MKLKILICALSMLFVGATASAEQANDLSLPIDIVVNDVFLIIENPAYMEDNVTYVPLRTAFSALGADVGWDAENSYVYISDGTLNVTLTEQGGTITSADVQTPIYTGFTMKDGVAYVPSRLVTDILGGNIEWNAEYAAVCITKGGVTVPETVINTSYGANEIYWMSRIIEAESSGEPFEGKIAVGNVIMNRVKSSQFPNTIFEVIFDCRYGVQFTPISNGSIFNNPSRDSIIAAKHALRNTNFAGESLYFFNPQTSRSNWISRNRTYYTSIASHDFYL